MAGRRRAVLLAVVTACALLPLPRAAAAPLPGAWCGPDESARDRPDLVAGNQIHVVYAYPTDGADRFDDMARVIVRDLAGVDTWWRSQDPLRTPRFDLAVFPGCDSEFGNLDVSSVPLSFDSRVYDPEGGNNFTGRVGDDLIANGLTDTNKKYLVYYDGPAGGGVCGRSTSSSVAGGPRRLSFVFLQGDPGCGIGGYGTGNGWPARTAAHELLHALNDYFAPDTAPNTCDGPRTCVRQHRRHLVDGHVASVTSAVRRHSRRRARRLLRPQRQLVGHPRLRLARPPGQPAGTAHRRDLGNRRRGDHLDTRRESVHRRVHEALRRGHRSTPHRRGASGYRLLAWGGACSGTSRSCETTVGSDGTAVTATFGPAVTVTARRVVPDRSCSSTAFRALVRARWT